MTDLAVFSTNNDLRADHARRSGHGRQPGRGLRDGSLRRAHRRQPGAGAAEGTFVHAADGTAGQLHRRTVGAKLQKLRIVPSGICSDEEFLRRVTLDIIGLLPTRRTPRSWPTSPDKRAKLIDELLDRKEFAEIWAMKWAELLMVKTIPNRVSTSRCSSTRTG